MTKQQIENKISELDQWLTANAEHTNYALVLQDKKDLEFLISKIMYSDGE